MHKSPKRLSSFFTGTPTGKITFHYLAHLTNSSAPLSKSKHRRA